VEESILPICCDFYAVTVYFANIYVSPLLFATYSIQYLSFPPSAEFRSIILPLPAETRMLFYPLPVVRVKNAYHLPVCRVLNAQLLIVPLSAELKTLFLLSEFRMLPLSLSAEP
jgi:hypothetical protein